MSCEFDVNKFIFYSSYYAMAADAGVEATFPLTDILNYTNQINPSDFAREDSQRSALANFQGVIGTAYGITTEFARDLTPMQQAFDSLSKYLQDVAGSTVTEYVQNNNIMVENSYAQIANVFGESIPDTNIKPSPTCTT